MNPNRSNQLQLNFSGLGCWVAILGAIWLLGAVGLGWVVKSLAVLVGLVLVAPVLGFVGLRFWLRRNLVQGPCPVCNSALTGIKGAETACLSCGTPLRADADGFSRLTEAGTIDVTAVDVVDITAETKTILPEAD